MKNINIFKFSLFLLLIFTIVNCNQPDNTSISTVSISLIDNNAKKSFARAPASSDITSFTLTVTGAGMSTISETYSASTTSIELDVPSGNNREFNLTVNMNSASDSAVLSWLGTATANLSGAATITLNMEIDETKLIIPDYLEAEIKILDDIDELTLEVITATDVGYGGGFNPYDIDFDDSGRIYIANNNGGTGFGRVIRIDDTSGANVYSFTEEFVGIIALAVDRENDYLYYASGTALWRTNLDNTGRTVLTINSGSNYNAEAITLIRGMDIDDSGILFIAGESGVGNDRIFRYDTATQIVTYSYGIGLLADPWDTLVKDDYIYVANLNGTANTKIMQFYNNLTYITGYGIDSATANTNPGIFYGPRRFIAILNRKITVIDEGPFPENIDKIASFDDIIGTDWETFPTGNDDGQSNFTFFNVC